MRIGIRPATSLSLHSVTPHPNHHAKCQRYIPYRHVISCFDKLSQYKKTNTKRPKVLTKKEDLKLNVISKWRRRIGSIKVANAARYFTSAVGEFAKKWNEMTECFLKYLDWKNSTTFSKASSSSSSYLSSAANLSLTAVSIWTPYWEPLISLITTSLITFSTGAAHIHTHFCY